jgi:uncharacterized protein YjiK
VNKHEAPGLVPGGRAAALALVTLAVLASSCTPASATEATQATKATEATEATEATKATKPAPAASSLGELSALVSLPDGKFLTVDDERGVLLLDSANATSGKLVVALNDLEGLCAAPDGRFLAIAEASGVVTAFTLDGKSETLGALAHPPTVDGKKSKKNKGWEGIVFLPADRSFDKKPHLVAVHEGAPKVLALFAWPSLAHEHTLPLGPYHDEKLVDLSDVGLDPKTGALLLVSDESARIVHAALVADPRGPTFAPVLDGGGIIELPMARDQKAEGVAVDDKGALWIVTDATGKLVQVASSVAPVVVPPTP